LNADEDAIVRVVLQTALIDLFRFVDATLRR
jgi:hypothetical protein